MDKYNWYTSHPFAAERVGRVCALSLFYPTFTLLLPYCHRYPALMIDTRWITHVNSNLRHVPENFALHYLYSPLLPASP